MDYKDYYKILGVNKNATEKEIKAAFRKLARQYHPDVNPGNKAAEEKFKELGEAYEALSDPQRRAAYDEYGHAAFDPRAHWVAFMLRTPVFAPGALMRCVRSR